MTKNDSHPVLRSAARGIACCAVCTAAALIITAAYRTSAAAPRTKAPAAADAGAVLPDPLDPVPQPWPSDTLLPPSPTEYLPSVRIGEESRRGDAETRRPIRLRPVAVLPERARKSDASQPYPLLEPSSGPAGADSPDPEQLFMPPGLTRPDQGRPRLSTDPTRDQSRLAVLTAVPRLRQKPAPFARLTIPDPFALTEPIALHTTPPDNDPPTPVQDFLKPPTLPSSAARKAR